MFFEPFVKSKKSGSLVFYKVSIDFLLFKNGSKIFYELLRPIPIHTEVSHIFEKIVIALIGTG